MCTTGSSPPLRSKNAMRVIAVSSLNLAAYSKTVCDMNLTGVYGTEEIGFDLFPLQQTQAPANHHLEYRGCILVRQAAHIRSGQYRIMLYSHLFGPDLDCRTFCCVCIFWCLSPPPLFWCSTPPPSPPRRGFSPSYVLDSLISCRW